MKINWRGTMHSDVQALPFTFKKQTIMETFKDIIANEPLVLVDFYATWCQPCKMMHPVLEQLKKDLDDKIRILKLDVDKNQPLAEQYRVQSVPTLILFSQVNNVWRQSGAVPLQALKNIIGPYC